MPNAEQGHFPPKNDDGSYKDVDMQFNRLTLKPDGQTIVDTKTGTSYDLSNIGTGGGSTSSSSASPFAEHDITQVTSTGDYNGLGSGIYQAQNKLVVVWVQATDHSSFGPLMAADTYDYGQTLTNVREIYAGPVKDGGFNTMGSGRFGALVREGTDTITFVYSDDDGATWSTSTAATGVSKQKLFHLYEYPSSAGGSDSGGYISYIHDNTSGDSIGYIATTDNGSSWTTGTAMPVPSGVNAVEPAVAKVPGEAKWIAVGRQQQSAGLNALGWTSTDMTNWSSSVDTGQTLGKNPPELLTYEGDIHWFAPSRAGNEIENYPLVMLSQSEDASTLYNDLTAWDGWNVWGSLGKADSSTYGPLGYLSIEKINGSYMASFCGWSDDNDQSQVGLITPFGVEDAQKLPKAFVHARRTGSGFTIPSGSATRIVFNTHVNSGGRGDRGEYDTSTGEFTAEEPGVYKFNSAVRWLDSVPSGTFTELQLCKNGSEVMSRVKTASGNTDSWEFGGGLELSKGDTASMKMYQDSGGSLDITYGGAATNMTITQTRQDEY